MGSSHGSPAKGSSRKVRVRLWREASQLFGSGVASFSGASLQSAAWVPVSRPGCPPLRSSPGFWDSAATVVLLLERHPISEGPRGSSALGRSGRRKVCAADPWGPVLNNRPRSTGKQPAQDASAGPAVSRACDLPTPVPFLPLPLVGAIPPLWAWEFSDLQECCKTPL